MSVDSAKRLFVVAALVCAGALSAYCQQRTDTINRWFSLSRAYTHQRDYGSSWGASGTFDISPDFGVLIGTGPTFTKYSYREDPFLYTTGLLGAIAIPSWRYEVTYNFYMPSFANRWALEFKAGVSTYESIAFYGYGSDTPRDPVKEDEGYYLMDSWLYSSRLFLGYGVTPSIWAGPLLTGNYLEMYDDSRDRLIDSVESVVLGAQRTYVGLGAQLFVDTRERSMYPRSGMYAAANAIGWFAADKGRQPFQTLQADIRLYTTPLKAEDLVLALRVGGMASFGEVIYYQSAVLGGRRSLRGYMFQRFRGDYSVYGSAEVRFPLFKQLIFLPVEFGAFFMGDVGRLWYQGESPGGMRGSWGIGIWGAGFSRDLLGILYVAFAREGAMVRAGFGFDY